MNKILMVGIVSSLLLFTGCDKLEKPQRDVFSGGEIVVDVSGETVKQGFIDKGVPGVDENSTIYGYKAYKISYETQDDLNNTVEVSGLMAVPVGVPEDIYNEKNLSLVSHSHSTIFSNAKAPSVLTTQDSAPQGISTVLTSLFGFVTLEADYIGFGDSSNQTHPFLLKKSLANASIDFIKAARVFAKANDIRLNNQLYVTGYSEGGYAALATVQKIEEDGEFNVTMARPLGAPYRIEELIITGASQETIQAPHFFMDIVYSYAKVKSIDLSTRVQEPYFSRLDTLFDGEHNKTEIKTLLTDKIRGRDGLLLGGFVNNTINNPASFLRKAARENDLHNWAPKTKITFGHCLGDELLPFSETYETAKTMQNLGAENIELLPIEIAVTKNPSTLLRMEHSECGASAYFVAATLFARERNATIGY